MYSPIRITQTQFCEDSINTIPFEKRYLDMEKGYLLIFQNDGRRSRLKNRNSPINGPSVLNSEKTPTGKNDGNLGISEKEKVRGEMPAKHIKVGRNHGREDSLPVVISRCENAARDFTKSRMALTPEKSELRLLSEDLGEAGNAVGVRATH
jgi:hypothetical protein